MLSAAEISQDTPFKEARRRVGPPKLTDRTMPPKVGKLLSDGSMRHTQSASVEWKNQSAQWESPDLTHLTGDEQLAAVSKARAAAMASLLNSLENRFAEQCGSKADPADWRIVAYYESLAHETVHPGSSTVFMDMTYCFERR